MALDLYNQFHVQFENNHPPIPGTFNKEKTSGYVSASPLEIHMGNHYLDDLFKQVDRADPQLFEAIKNIADFVRENFAGKKAITLENQMETAKKEQATW